MDPPEPPDDKVAFSLCFNEETTTMLSGSLLKKDSGELYYEKTGSIRISSTLSPARLDSHSWLVTVSDGRQTMTRCVNTCGQLWRFFSCKACIGSDISANSSARADKIALPTTALLAVMERISWRAMGSGYLALVGVQTTSAMGNNNRDVIVHDLDGEQSIWTFNGGDGIFGLWLGKFGLQGHNNNIHVRRFIGIYTDEYFI
jgi:hypothetical protein